MHWAKECKSKFDIEGKPIPGNSKQETPQVPFNKNQGQIPSFPSNPQHPAVLPDVPALNSFTLKQSPLEYLLDFLGPCPHQPSVFHLANLDWLNRQEGQGSPNGENRLQVSDIFISLKQQEETN